jgi:hypothetical protein
MNKAFVRLIGATFAALSLAACSSEQNGGEQGLPRLLLGSVQEIVSSRRAGPLPKIELTPAMLAQANTAVLQINPEVRGGSDFLRRIETRRDSFGGTVEVWRASDDAQVFLRNGVVIGTRGIGGDIIAANAAVTVNALGTRRDSGGIREYTVSDGDVTATSLKFRCDIRNLGEESISLVNQVFTTDHLRETCVSSADPTVQFRNDYWVQKSSGLLRKSRQWMGPAVGSFELLLLND